MNAIAGGDDHLCSEDVMMDNGTFLSFVYGCANNWYDVVSGVFQAISPME